MRCSATAAARRGAERDLRHRGYAKCASSASSIPAVVVHGSRRRRREVPRRVAACGGDRPDAGDAFAARRCAAAASLPPSSVDEAAHGARARERQHVGARDLLQRNPDRAATTVLYAPTSVTAVPASSSSARQHVARFARAVDAARDRRGASARSTAAATSSLTYVAGTRSARTPLAFAIARRCVRRWPQPSRPRSRARRASRAASRSKNASTPFCDVKTIHANDASSSRACVCGARIAGRLDGDRRRRDRFGAAFAGARARTRPTGGPARVIEHALAEERSAIEPAQRLAQAHDAADHDDRGRADVRARDLGGDRRERTGHRSLARARAVLHDRDRRCRRRARARRAAARSRAESRSPSTARASAADRRASPSPASVAGLAGSSCPVMHRERRGVLAMRHRNAGVGGRRRPPS